MSTRKQHVLIAGANSYIGDAAHARLSAAGHAVTVLDMLGDGWRKTDFTPFDTVFHVAGIAHLKEKRTNKDLYFSVNAELPVAVARRARESGCKQFIFMSSMSVYAGHGTGHITAGTPCKPGGYYGQSKLQADLALQQMDSERFRVAVLRPPMVFGKGCKGNFPRLVKLARTLPVFPAIRNARSMLHMDNLCELVRLIVETNASGLFFPQNAEYFCTSDLAARIAEASGKKLRTTRLCNGPVWLLRPFLPPLRKLFGNLTYGQEMSDHFEGRYRVVDNRKSIEESI